MVVPSALSDSSPTVPSSATGLLPVLGLGAGGHARSVIDAIRLQGRYLVRGLLDAAPRIASQSVMGVPVLGGDEQLELLLASGIRHAFIGVGTSRNTTPRVLIWNRLRELNYEVIEVVHPTAIVSPAASVERGATLLARSVIGAEARLGTNVIVNTGAIVEHDCRVGDHVHIATGAVLTGGVVVEERAFVGAGACVLPGVCIGARAVVGAGAVVVRDVPPDGVVVGNPARPLGQKEGSWTIRAAS